MLISGESEYYLTKKTFHKGNTCEKPVLEHSSLHTLFNGAGFSEENCFLNSIWQWLPDEGEPVIQCDLHEQELCLFKNKNIIAKTS